jgi:Thioredoxin-like [2Fe-2S] ferredoxin
MTTASANSNATAGKPSGKVLTDEMIAEIKAFFPRYPSKQAVTLPALHIVNEKLRYVPFQAVVEVAELLELHPAVVQDTLSFYGYFKQDKPHGRGFAGRSLVTFAGRTGFWSTFASGSILRPAKRRMMGRSQSSTPSVWAHVNMLPAFWRMRRCTSA